MKIVTATRNIVGGGIMGLLALFPQPGQAQAPAPRVTAAELVGAWTGRLAETSAGAAPEPTAAGVGQRLVFRADSSYAWTTVEAPPTPALFHQWHALRGDTLVLDSTHVYTIARNNHELWLTALGSTDAGPVFRFERDWTTQPVTGRARPCRHQRLYTFACRNVELLAYLPSESLGGAVGTDVWGWHDSTTGREFLLTGGYTGGSTAFVEVTDPLHPRYLGLLLPHDSVTLHAHGRQSVKVYHQYAFVTYERSGAKPGLQIFDLTQLRTVRQPTMFHETAYYHGFGYALSLTLNPATGFLTANGSDTCGGGPHLLDVRTPTQPVFLGCYTEPQLDGGTGYVNDAQCVVYHGPDRAYQGRELCVVYGGTHVGVVDVSDKRHPTTLSLTTYPKAASATQGWFTADQRYVLVSDEADEMRMASEVGVARVQARTIVLDMADLTHPVVRSEFYNPNSRVTDHNLYIRGRYAYQANYGAGLRILDLAVPTAPREVGVFSPKRNDVSDQNYEVSGLWQGPRAFSTYPYLASGAVAVSFGAGLALVRLRP